MKTKTILSLLLLALSTVLNHAADIAAVASGDWGDTNVWETQSIPATNDSVYIAVGFNVLVNSNATIAFIDGPGTVTMGAGATLNVLGDPLGAYGTQTLGLLDTTAPGNTVNYQGNAFWAKRQDYFNLVFSGAGNFFNGAIPGYSAVPMYIAGDMTLSGTNVAVQQGADIVIGGNLSILGATNKWDCSSFQLTVTSNTIIGGVRGLMVDLDGALGSNYFGGNVTVAASALAWNLSDVTQWAMGGSLTNLGLIAGKGYGSISFDGEGFIAGNPIRIPTLTINGTYTIATTITLTTNTPTLNGTLVFDLANTNQIILPAYVGTALYYDGTLNVINTGPAPAPGNSYKFFDAGLGFGGTFASVNLPPLASGLTWTDNLLTSGSILVEGSALASPVLTLVRSGNLLTLSWDSDTFPGFQVQAQTNATGIGNNWGNIGSGTVSPVEVPIDPANPPVFFRLSNP